MKEALRDVIDRTIGMSDEDKTFLSNRAAVAERYCKEKGWPLEPSELSITQILEIREQEDWKNGRSI